MGKWSVPVGVTIQTGWKQANPTIIIHVKNSNTNTNTTHKNILVDELWKIKISFL